MTGPVWLASARQLTGRPSNRINRSRAHILFGEFPFELSSSRRTEGRRKRGRECNPTSRKPLPPSDDGQRGTCSLKTTQSPLPNSGSSSLLPWLAPAAAVTSFGGTCSGPLTHLSVPLFTLLPKCRLGAE